MGVIEKVGGPQKTYWSTFRGEFVRSVKADWAVLSTDENGVETLRDGLTSRVNANGRKVYEKYVEGLCGAVTDIKISTHEEYGEKLVIELTDLDDNEINVISLGMFSAKRQVQSDPASLIMQLAAIFEDMDQGKELVFKPYNFETKDGKKPRGITVYCGPDKVSNLESYKAVRAALPQPVQIEAYGKTMWDYSQVSIKQYDIIQRLVKHFAANKPAEPVAAAPAAVAAAPAPQVSEPIPDEAADMTDDLPF